MAPFLSGRLRCRGRTFCIQCSCRVGSRRFAPFAVATLSSVKPTWVFTAYVRHMGKVSLAGKVSQALGVATQHSARLILPADLLILLHLFSRQGGRQRQSRAQEICLPYHDALLG